MTTKKNCTMKHLFLLAVSVMMLTCVLDINAATTENDIIESSNGDDMLAYNDVAASDSLLRDALEKLSSKSKNSADSSVSDTVDDDDDNTATVADDTSTTSSKSSSVSKAANLVCDVIGLNKMKESTLVGTWTYKEPAVAFTSESLLAEAGGAIAASACESQLVSAYESLGINSSNTSFTFNDDGSFTVKLIGHSVKGTYTFDEDEQAVTLKVLVLSLPGYTKKNTDGMSLMFESQKILSLLEAICKISGSKILSAVGSLSESYEGVRIGFDLTK